MADSVDRVFVHALNTVKKIPKAGASRPPPADRLRLYGLYKQAMEGDVDGVMERPISLGSGNNGSNEVNNEKGKYDAWDAQRGLSRTEAKRRYISSLIDTMHKYASTTADARALVDELEFVWDQIKNNQVSSSGSSPGRERIPSYASQQPRRSRSPIPGTNGPMRVLSPMSQDDEAESSRKEGDGAVDQEELVTSWDGRTKVWRKTVEQALVKMTAEVAALREQMATGREHQGKRRRSSRRWITWLFWNALKHTLIDAALLGLLLLWLRKRKDRRLEDLVKHGCKIGREYIRKILPAR